MNKDINIKTNIKKILDHKNINKLEKLGIVRDLEVISQKIEKGEYKKGFLVQNEFDIPSRTESLFREMEFLMQLGHDWENILKKLPLNKNSLIVDLCPGFTPKIELGLYFLGFKGKIFVLDKDKKSVNSLTRFMQLFEPEYKICQEIVNLFSPIKLQYDFVLGNHIVDDLVVYYFTKKEKIKLTDFYASESIAVDIWRKVLSNKLQNIDDVSIKIADILESITADSGYICLSQYKSYTEKLFDLNEAYTFNIKVFSKVKSILLERGFMSQPKIITKMFLNYKGHFSRKNVILLQKYGKN